MEDYRPAADFEARHAADFNSGYRREEVIAPVATNGDAPPEERQPRRRRHTKPRRDVNEPRA